MALKKNKWDILGKIIFKSEIDYQDDYENWACDIDWDDDGWDGWQYEEYEYLNPKYDFTPGIRRINMKSIYSKESIRDKKLNEILGISKEFSKITIGEIYKNNDSNLQ